MSAKILDGKELAEKLLNHVRTETQPLVMKPNLVAISSGDNKESELYLRKKKEAASSVGIIFTHLHFENATTEKLAAKIDELNKSPAVSGIMVQLPLPEGVDESIIMKSIVPWKDIDGFHPYNKGLLDTNETQMIPPTAYGVIKLLEENNILIKGKNAVIIGAGEIAGKPTAKLLLNKGATVTVCHKETSDIKEHIKNADILVTAVGYKNLVKGKDIKEGAVVVNIGMTYDEDGLHGDVEFESAKEKASWITPTPGGTGPMTVALLMVNTLVCYKMIQKGK